MTEVGDQLRMDDVSDEYKAFVDKFKPKKTTDDCYTPEPVMNAVNEWVEKEYGIDKTRFVRPFWPGGDYKRHEYPDGCAVVDNPPFSILSEICDWYSARHIPFFLFAPALTVVNLLARRMEMLCVMLCGVKVTYENGANVNTGFVTNMECEYCIRCVPELRAQVQAAADQYAKVLTKTLPKYIYPYHVVSSKDYLLAQYGQDFRVRRDEAVFVRKLDAMQGKAIFGGGVLLSERAAAERAAAERAAAERAAAERAAAERAAAERAAATVWQLSEREKDIIKRLGNVGDETGGRRRE